MRRIAEALVLALLLAGCMAASPPPTAPDTGDAAAAEAAPPAREAPFGTALLFDPPIVIDALRPGGEPVILRTQAGTLLVAAHPGPTHSSPLVGQPDPALATYTGENPMWRSTDGGDTWSYVGFAAGLGPRDAEFSISDPDLAQDAAGHIYHVSLYNPGYAAVGIGIGRSDDDGRTWTGRTLVEGGDRPWIVARDEHEVWVVSHGNVAMAVPGSQGLNMAKVGDSPFRQPDANMQLAPDGSLVHGGFPGLARSVDDGRTWTQVPDNQTPADSPGWMMAEPVFDAAATAYTAWFHDGQVHYSIWPDNGTRFAAQHRVTDLPGTHLWPWAVAGDAGRLAIVWLGSEEAAGPGSDVGWHIYAAIVENASGTPRWTVARATESPVHEGVLCQSGVGCAAASDRRLGDFFTATTSAEGRLLIATAVTRWDGEGLGQDGWWGRPALIRQVGGPALVEAAAPVEDAAR